MLNINNNYTLHHVLFYQVDDNPLVLPDLEGIVILNIQRLKIFTVACIQVCILSSWGAGAEIWGNPSDHVSPHTIHGMCMSSPCYDRT